MRRLILGSQSPRRREIMGYFSLPFEVATSDFDEDGVPFRGDPSAYVCEIADGKAHLLAKKHPEAVILTADTTVYKGGRIFGKPATQEEALEFFSSLSGSWHSVYTGVALQRGSETWSAFEETRVLFNDLSPAEILAYHAQLHWADKAGGYTAQMAGGLAIKRIEGCYYNVLGLPINTVRKLLLEVGIDLWNYLR